MATQALLKTAQGQLNVQVVGFGDIGSTFPPEGTPQWGLRVGGPGLVNDCCLRLYIQAVNCITHQPADLWFPVTQDGKISATVLVMGTPTAMELDFFPPVYFYLEASPSEVYTFQPGATGRCSHGTLATEIVLTTGCEECEDCQGDPEGDPAIPASLTPRRINVDFSEIGTFISGVVPATDDIPPQFVSYAYQPTEHCLCWNGDCTWTTKKQIPLTFWRWDGSAWQSVQSGDVDSEDFEFPYGLLEVTATRSGGGWTVSAHIVIPGFDSTVDQHGGWLETTAKFFLGSQEQGSCTEETEVPNDYEAATDFALAIFEPGFPGDTPVETDDAYGVTVPGPCPWPDCAGGAGDLVNAHIGKGGSATVTALGARDGECERPCCFECCHQIRFHFRYDGSVTGYPDEAFTSPTLTADDVVTFRGGRNGQCEWINDAAVDDTLSVTDDGEYFELIYHTDTGGGGTIILRAPRDQTCPPTDPAAWEVISDVNGVDDGPTGLTLEAVVGKSCPTDSCEECCFRYTFSFDLGGGPVSQNFDRQDFFPDPAMWCEWGNAGGDFLVQSGNDWILGIRPDVLGAGSPLMIWSATYVEGACPPTDTGSWNLVYTESGSPSIDSISTTGCP